MHYFILLEIMTFVANLITNIIIAAVASYIDIKITKKKRLQSDIVIRNANADSNDIENFGN